MSCYQEEASDSASIMQYHVLFDHLYDFKQYSQYTKSLQPHPIVASNSPSYINFNLPTSSEKSLIPVPPAQSAPIPIAPVLNLQEKSISIAPQLGILYIYLSLPPF